MPVVVGNGTRLARPIRRYPPHAVLKEEGDGLSGGTEQGAEWVFVFVVVAATVRVDAVVNRVIVIIVSSNLPQNTIDLKR